MNCTEIASDVVFSYVEIPPIQVQEFRSAQTLHFLKLKTSSSLDWILKSPL